jgi:hypothetical protein
MYTANRNMFLKAFFVMFNKIIHAVAGESIKHASRNDLAPLQAEYSSRKSLRHANH